MADTQIEPAILTVDLSINTIRVCILNDGQEETNLIQTTLRKIKFVTMCGDDK